MNSAMTDNIGSIVEVPRNAGINSGSLIGVLTESNGFGLSNLQLSATSTGVSNPTRIAENLQNKARLRTARAAVLTSNHNLTSALSVAELCRSAI